MPALKEAKTEKIGILAKIEIGEFQIPFHVYRKKYLDDHLAIMEVLKTIPEGQSIRVPYLEFSKARSYSANLLGFLKKQELSGKYFVASRNVAEDGKFYVYIGSRRAE